MKPDTLRCRLIAALVAAVVLQCVGTPSSWAQLDVRYESESTAFGETPESESNLSTQQQVAPQSSPYGAPQYDGRPERRVFENINLAIELPGGPWRPLMLPSKPTTAGIMAIQQDPEIAVVIGGERLGVEMQLDPKMVTRLAQTVARSRLPEVTFVNETPLAIGTLAGQRQDATGSHEGTPVYGVIWTAQRQGYLYYVMAFGEAHHTGAVEAAHRLFRERIAQIDPQRVAHVDAGALAKKFESANFGYSVDLENMGWLNGGGSKEGIDGSEFSADCGPLSLSIIPIPLPGRTVDMEILTKVCLARLNLKYPENVRPSGTFRLGSLEGRTFEATKPWNSEMVQFRVRLAASDRVAYLMLGIAVEGDETALARVDAALDRVTLTGKALPRDPEIPFADRALNGLTLNEIGLNLYQQGDLTGAHDFFAGAYKLHPSDNAVLSNYVETLSELGRTPEALAILQQHVTKYPDSQRIQAIQAKLLGANGQSDDARRQYVALFAQGYVDESALGDYLKLAADAKAYDEAIRTVQQFALRRPTIDVQITLATLYSEKGDHDTAIARLQSLHSQNPNNMDVALRLSRVYGDAEKHDEAIAITQQLIDSGRRDEIVLLLHGKNQLNAEHLAAAKQTFEQAAKQYPHSELAKEMVNAASSQLGQGDNSALTTPIAPVDIPPAVRTAIQQAPIRASSGLEKYGAEEQVRIVGVSYKRNQLRRTTTSRRIKVHTAGGVSQYSTLTFDLNPTGERFFVNRLVVLDAAGKQVAEGSVDTYYVVDDSSSGVASNAKVVTVPVPGLKAGYTIECMVTREDRAPSEKYGFDETLMSSKVPVGVSVYYVTGDTQGLKYKTSLPLQVVASKDLLYCVTANPAPFREEIKQPPVERFLPVVWVGEADSSWEREAHEYLEMVAGKLTLDEDTRRLSTELTRDCQTNRAKLAVLARYAQSACTYQAIEFGRRARVPNAASQTLALKYGDCKDHALLLKQLLAGVGIRAELAVVHSSKPITPEFPSLDQFNHMVLYVPGDTVGQAPNAIGGLIIDATQKNADPLLFPPHGLADKSFLVLDAKQPRVVHTPAYPLDVQQLTSQRRIVVRQNPSQNSLVEVDVQERLTLNAYIAPGMRAYLRSFEPGERREALQSVLAASQNIRLKSVDVEHLEDVSQPLVLNLNYTLPDALHALASGVTGNTIVGRIPAFWETYFIEADYLDSRETPFELGTPRLVRSSLDIVLPEGYQMSDVDQLSNSGQSPFAAWASRARAADSTVHVDFMVRVVSGRYAAKDYPAYYAGMKESLTILQTPMTFRTEALMATQPASTMLR